MGSLTNLEKLYLSNNQVKGEIPPELGSLTNLEKLYLSNNQVKGEIPPELGSLANLTHLHLNNNGLSGVIPPQLQNLASLEELNLASNQLSGPVPAGLGNLAALTLLYLDTNQLSGELPSQLGNLSELQQVSIWGNKLTWADSYANGLLGDMVALMAFYESTNGPEWGKRFREEFVWLSYRRLSEWGGVTTTGMGGRVIELDFSSSAWDRGEVGLSGRIPPELGLLTSLEKLSLQGRAHQLSGAIPPELGRLASLEKLILNNNELTGAIPPELGRLASLEKLNLASNQLSGAVPAELGNLANLTQLYLDTNQLSGELPSQLGNLADLRQVSIWDNKLTWANSYANGYLGDMVALVALYEGNNGPGWRNGGSYRHPRGGLWLSYNPLGEWKGVTTSGAGGRVAKLDLSHMRIDHGEAGMIGPIPPELGLLTSLEKLNLGNYYGGRKHQLSGCIPGSLRGVEYTGAPPFCN